jgi:hypothetical protein
MKKCVAYIQKRSYMRERLFQRKLLKWYINEKVAWLNRSLKYIMWKCCQRNEKQRSSLCSGAILTTTSVYYWRMKKKLKYSPHQWREIMTLRERKLSRRRRRRESILYLY